MLSLLLALITSIFAFAIFGGFLIAFFSEMNGWGFLAVLAFIAVGYDKFYLRRFGLHPWNRVKP